MLNASSTYESACASSTGVSAWTHPWLLATCNKVFEFMEASSRPDSFIYYYYYYCIYYTRVVRTTLEILQQPNSLAKLGLGITSKHYTMPGVHDWTRLDHGQCKYTSGMMPCRLSLPTRIGRNLHAFNCYPQIPLGIVIIWKYYNNYREYAMLIASYWY